MMEEEEQLDEMSQIAAYYKYMSQQIEQKFKNMTTSTMEQIKAKFKRRQDKQSQEEQVGLIEKERQRIINEMKQHIKVCFHPHCIFVDQIVVLYNLFRGQHAQKQDPITLILHQNVQGLPKLETDCPEGKKLNAKMRETHKMIVAM